MTRIAVVLVTRDAQAWLEPLLTSIAAQTRPADRIVAVDDGSRDATVDILRTNGVEVLPATTSAGDVTTRIAANFVQGVRACADADLVALGDHDDLWHPDRLARQQAILADAPAALMVASDGRLVDADGAPLGGTLRTAFPVTESWESMTAADRMAYVLAHSVATGGASMVRPAVFPMLDVPAGWLHDRWWSLVATARTGMLVDRTCVIDYRVQPGQQVGVDAAAQGGGVLHRLGTLARDAQLSVRKYRDARRLLRPLAVDPGIASRITLGSMIGGG
jgi:glycosyltransferase involved in cell wall biosynthesis